MAAPNSAQAGVLDRPAKNTQPQRDYLCRRGTQLRFLARLLHGIAVVPGWLFWSLTRVASRIDDELERRSAFIQPLPEQIQNHEK